MRKEDNMPALRFPGFEDKWQYNTLGNLLEFKNGINANKDQYGHGVKFINVLDILNNDFITYDKIIGSVAVDENTIDKNAVRYGDILFQRSSETREEVGSASVYLDQEKIATFGGFVIRGKKIADYVPEFFNKLLKTDTARDSITSRSGGSTRFNVGQETLSSVNLAFPSFSEQLKIASFLTSVDEILTKLKKQKTLLEQYKKGVMQKIFSQEIRFNVENREEFPEWKVKKFGDVAEINLGQSPESYSYNSEGIGKYLIQGNADITNRISNPRGWTSDPTKECQVGDIILTVRAPVGSVAKSNHNACIGRGVCGIRNKSNSIIDYLYQFLIYFEPQWIRIEQGSTFTAISGSDIRSIEIQLPCLAEQTKIANFLSALDDKINHCIVQIEKTEQWERGLLQRMFC